MLRRFLIAVAAVATLGLGGSAIAGSLDLGGVPASSLHGSKNVPNQSIGHLSLKNHIVNCQKLSYDVLRSLPSCNGGNPRPPYPVSGSGPAGPAGPKGATGAAGKDGTNGTNGVDGKDGKSCESVILDSKTASIQEGNPCQGPRGYKGEPGAPGANAPGVVVTHVTGPDSNVCGGDWANDDYTRTLQFLPQSDGSITVIRTYNGTFTTIAGASAPNGPCNNDQVGGVTGTFTGFDVVSVTGGYFNPGATCADPCTGSAMVAAFFPGGTLNGPVNGWEYHYDAGTNGTWVNADAVVRGGNSGNITG